MRNFLKIIFFILFLILYVFPQTPSIVKVKIDNLLADEFFNSTLIAVEAFNLSNGDIVYRKNERMLLHPASNMKIITSAAALLFLGSGYQFQTGFYHTGEILNKTLHGDIIVKGGFDPDFSSKDLDSVSSVIYSSGIREIKGRIIGDVTAKDSLFLGKGWMWDDDPSPDAPYLSSLNINDNSIEVFIRGKTSGSPPEIILKPFTSYVNVINNCRTISPMEKDSIEVKRDWIKRNNNILIEGTVNKTIFPDTFSVKKTLNLYEPEIYFLTLFLESLERKGISVEDKAAIGRKPGSAAELFTFSRGIDSVIINMNKNSDNLNAEMLLYALALLDSGEYASADGGLKFADSLIVLSGLKPGDYELADGSGVSRYNLVSAEVLVNVLKLIYSHPAVYKIIYNSLPVAGTDGTLKYRMRGTNLENNLRGKTGSLKGVQSLSGYLNSSSGDLIAFSIMVQNYTGPSAAAQFYIDEICRILSE